MVDVATVRVVDASKVDGLVVVAEPEVVGAVILASFEFDGCPPISSKLILLARLIAILFSLLELFSIILFLALCLVVTTGDGVMV